MNYAFFETLRTRIRSFYYQWVQKTYPISIPFSLKWEEPNVVNLHLTLKVTNTIPNRFRFSHISLIYFTDFFLISSCFIQHCLLKGRCDCVRCGCSFGRYLEGKVFLEGPFRCFFYIEFKNFMLLFNSILPNFYYVDWKS